MLDLHCVTCHRHVRRTTLDGPLEAVVVEGGARRPHGTPEVDGMRGALRAAAEGRVVVGVCDVCGQPTTTARSALSDDDVVVLEVEGAEGPLVLGASGPVLAGAPVDVDAAATWLDDAHPHRPLEGWRSDLSKLPLFLVVVPFVVGWFAAAIFVIAFLAAIWEGPPAPVMDTPGFDRTRDR